MTTATFPLGNHGAWLRPIGGSVPGVWTYTADRRRIALAEVRGYEVYGRAPEAMFKVAEALRTDDQASP